MKGEFERVWIDIVSGTWGQVRNLRIVDLEEIEDAESDVWSYIAFLEGASDSEICEFGERYGIEVR